MVGLALAAEHGERLARLVVVGAADRAHPLATAWRSVQRRILAWGSERGEGPRAVALARALAMTTYRGADELLARFSEPPEREDGAFVFPVERYLASRGEDFASRMDAGAYAALSLAMDLHRVDPAAITVPTTLVAASSDQLVPLAQMQSLRGALGGPATLHVVDTPFGHDAFLKETDRVGAIVRAALEREEEAR
jgi:homoserine O-acetyltransferase